MPTPSRREQDYLQYRTHVPFSHGAGADADVSVNVYKTAVLMVLARLLYNNVTGLAEAAANFATLMLQYVFVYADKAVSAVDTVDNELDFATDHELETGDGPIRLTTTGGAPAGLATGTDYFVIRVNARSIGLASSIHLAIAGTKIDITTAGTGVHTIVDTATTSRKLAYWSTDSDLAGADNGIPANAFLEFTLARETQIPAGSTLVFVADEDGTTTVPAGSGIAELVAI